MSRRYDDYDEYDRYDDDDLCEEDIRETYKAIEALTVDNGGGHAFVSAVNKVFFDIFGIKEVGTLFASKNRRYDRYRVDVFRKCGTERLVDMIFDIETYKTLQALVKLHYDINRGRVDKNKADEVSNVYLDTIERIKRMYGIRTRSSVSSINNPLKMLRKMNRDYDDGIGIYEDFDDDLSYYDDYDRYDRGSRRRRRRRDDDYDDSDFISSILDGVDPDVIKRKGRSERKRSKRSDSGRDRRNDRDREYDDDETDYDSSVVDALGKITDKLDSMDSRLSSIEKDSYYDEPAPKRRPERNSYEDRIAESIDILDQNIQTIAKNQKDTRVDVDTIIEVLHHLAHEDDEEEEYDGTPNESVDESPGDKSGGDLLKSTGGIVTDPEQIKKI